MGFTDLNNGSSTSTGGSLTSIAKPTVGFGGLEVQQLKPVAQGDFIYQISATQVFSTASFVGSSITQVDGLAVLSSGTNVSGSAIVDLRRGVKYRPGQGSIMRATALFGTPQADSRQLIGLANAECGYSFGYNGTNFGIFHKESGTLEIRKLEITTAATNGDTITITLDGDDYEFDIDIEGTTSTTQTAYKIAQQDFTQIGKTGFRVDVIGSDVYFIASRCNPSLTGSYSVSGGTIAGTFTRLATGADYTLTFISSSQFNIDKLDGTGESGMVINPQKGNVYEVDFQYLGFGNARFAVENPQTGRFIDCHMIKNANARTTPVLKNPNVKVRLECSNNGNTTPVELKSASMAGFIGGNIEKLDPKFSQSWTFSDLKSLTYTPLALVKVHRVFNNQPCFGEFDILKIGASNETASKTLSIGFFLKSQITGDVVYENVKQGNSIVSVADFNPGGVTPVNSISNLADIQPFHEIIVGAESGLSHNLDSMEFIFSPGDPLLIAVKVSSGPVAGVVSLNWFEQQ